MIDAEDKDAATPRTLSAPSPSVAVTGGRLSGDDLVTGLKAIGEPTRLRIAALVAEGELTVTELCRILGQSQPRVSRHLKLLCDAGLLDRHSEGRTNAFFSPAAQPGGRSVLERVIALIDPADPQLIADHQRLADIRAERAAQADDYFDRIAEQWESMRSRHVSDRDVEALMVDLIDRHRRMNQQKQQPSLLLDVGTGTGRVLELLAGRFDRCIGIDLSTNMLNLARTRLLEQGLHNCSVRQNNIYALDTEIADVAVLHHVLHFLDDPDAALRQTSFSLSPGGLVVIVDFAPHDLDELRVEHNHQWMGFSDAQIERWCDEAWIEIIENHHLTPVDSTAADKPLTVSVWVGRRRLQ